MNNFYYYIGGAIIIIAVIVFVVIKTNAYKYIKSDQFKDTVHKLMVMAEDVFEGSQGAKRLEWVCERAYAIIPTNIKKYVTLDMLIKLVNELFRIYAEKVGTHMIVK
mgnify:CR=1 FL=1